MKARHFVTGMVAMVLLPFVAVRADAAPPGNDELQGAVALQLADRVVQDTSEATTTPGDTALNANCGAPATTASVWYSYTPDRDRTVVLDMTDSNYSGGFLVFAGTPTADSLVLCGPGLVALRARTGQTYTVMVFSDTTTNGGRLVLSLDEPPPPPRVHVSLARTGVAFRNGDARIHGSYSCKRALFTSLQSAVFQRAGRLKVRGESGKEIRCDGRRHDWSARVVSPVGTYAPGNAFARVKILACGMLDCSRDVAERQLHLARASVSHRQSSMPAPTTRSPHPRPLVGQQEHWPTR